MWDIGKQCGPSPDVTERDTFSILNYPCFLTELYHADQDHLCI